MQPIVRWRHLGTLLGYDKIPAYWKMGLKEAEDIDFKYTTISLNKVYQLGFKHALGIIERNGGKIKGDEVSIVTQSPKVVRLEQGFTNLLPTEMRAIQKDLVDEYTVDFEGTGFVINGEARPKQGSSWDYSGNFVFKAELYVDGQLSELAELPVIFTKRRHELFWKYQLPKGDHTMRIKLLNPDANHALRLESILIYTDQP